MRPWFVAIVSVFAASAWAGTAKWGVVLPEAEGTVELPPADVEIWVERSGTSHVGRTWVPAVVPEGADAAPAAADALRAAVPSPGPEARARILADRDVAFGPVRNVLLAIVEAGLPHADLAGGPDGARGFTAPFRFELAPPTVTEARVPLTVHLMKEAVWVARVAREGALRAVPPGPERHAFVGLLAAEERRLHPGERLVVVNTDDDVPWSDTFGTIAALRAHGFDQLLLAGGPPPDHAPRREVRAPTPTASLQVPTTVTVLSTGRLTRRGKAVTTLDAADLVGFLEDCERDPCALVAVPRTGAPVVVGRRPEELRAYPGLPVLGRPVWAAPGVTAKVERLPTVEGRLGPFRRIEGSDEEPPGRPVLAPQRMGKLPEEAIDAVVERNFARPRACYEAALRRDATERGEVVVAFTIEPDGTVRDAQFASSDVADPYFEPCIVEAFRGLRFPRPEGGVVHASYPFVFMPG